PQPEIVVLELSSYQLHYTKHFAPDMAIWTNFFPNHLDHHTTKKEYFWAKCNIIKHQTEKHIALLPYSLIETIKKHIIMSCKVYLFVSYKPRKKLIYPTFYIHKNNAVLDNGSTKIIIFKNIHQLPDVTFPENWLIIIASLYLQKISFDQLNTMARTLQDQHHRVEFVRNFNGVSIYNDSKSTVWQSTHKALQRFKDKKIALFLGGLSKGTNRAPLIQSLAQQNVTVFAFGKEAALLSSLCEKFQVQCYVSTTLQQALEKYLSLQNNFEILLFSPAGSSFDLFKNYIDRGNQFKNMIMKL
ncbi:MAG TPA: UDP-N-acetylmuramoyl-L-alanine--D-glutamate ligase, partial [Candidatus Saccharimonadales bacterium]|nr:UDP-N-acetylmuramoyl-L-alanine--D-glutamate ligase [Candidatus Saccharimonadales bacterium]